MCYLIFLLTLLFLNLQTFIWGKIKPALLKVILSCAWIQTNSLTFQQPTINRIYIRGTEEVSMLTHLILWALRIQSQESLIIEDKTKSVSAAVMFLRRPLHLVMTLYMYCSPRVQSVQICNRGREKSKLHHLNSSEPNLFMWRICDVRMPLTDILLECCKINV